MKRVGAFRLAQVAVGALLLVALLPGNPAAAPRADLWARWEPYDSASRETVDHSPWGRFLSTYLVTSHPSGIHRIRYRSVTPGDREALHGYLDSLGKVRVASLNRAEQKAFWINLYNALTVRVILDHHPVRSIRDIDISPGFWSDGPWGAKLATIEGEKVSLDDIEHRILRPIWKDPRIHYAVNCASLGCPDLLPEPFTAENTERLLEAAARRFVNHPRGVRPDGTRLFLSSIYDWFRGDFGPGDRGAIPHLIRYANPDLARFLREFRGSVAYGYDWRLNE